MTTTDITEQYKGCQMILTDLRLVSGTTFNTRWAFQLDVRRNTSSTTEPSLINKRIFFIALGMPSWTDATALALGHAMRDCDGFLSWIDPDLEPGPDAAMCLHDLQACPPAPDATASDAVDQSVYRSAQRSAT